MTEPTSGAMGLAFFKLYGLKAGLGMMGAALLYLVAPPTKADGKFDRREFAVRLACAGTASELFGDLAVELLKSWVAMSSWLQGINVDDHKGAVYLLVGAPAWWITRAAALWLQKRNGKDIAEVVKEVREA
ncbi:hypothetical protein [Noviherbaspirillum malthae]|uniref:hypothetical protein n=1 Tax=Noviherbaspirillum malthae TaxID=1260987 RepID=UPI00188FE1D6|nr:hypothetical protein [Noviherbaspirillum malthae]